MNDSPQLPRPLLLLREAPSSFPPFLPRWMAAPGERERERKRMRRGLFPQLLLPPPPRFSYSNGGAAFSHKKFFPVSLPPSFFGEGDKFSFLHPALEKKSCLDSVSPWT